MGMILIAIDGVGLWRVVLPHNVEGIFPLELAAAGHTTNNPVPTLNRSRDSIAAVATVHRLDSEETHGSLRGRSM